MRTGLNFLQAVIGLTTITVLVACGDDGGGTGGGGDGGSGSGTTNTSTSSSPTTGTVTGSTGASPVGPGPSSSSTGGNDCTSTITFQDPDIDACAYANCCDELLACEADDFANCTNADGTLDPESQAGAPLVACLEDAECFSAGGVTYCDSTIGYGPDAPEELEAEIECFNESCCDTFAECTNNGTDETGCVDCLNGDIIGPDGLPDFSRCDDAHACSLSACDVGIVFYPYCDSGIGSSGSIPVNECLATECCEAWNACTGGPYTDAELQNGDATEGVEACIACLEAGGGDLCDAAIACEEENCNTAICDSGIVINDPETAACVAGACCAEYNACTGGPYTDEDFEDQAVIDAINACIDCFIEDAENGDEPPGALCAAAVACDEANCSGGEGGGGGGGGGAGGAGGAGG